MDIFKVPTCCSCHIHGYSDIFPPHQKDPPPKFKESFPGADFISNNNNHETDDNYEPNYGVSSEEAPSIYHNNIAEPGKKSKRPSSTRSRPKKPASSSSRPFDKIPHQHAPNTRAPGYKGSAVSKGSRTKRPLRSFRRKSAEENHSNSTTVNNR